MHDLHSALKTEVVQRAGWDGGEAVLVQLQQGKDQVHFSLHIRPSSFTTYGVQMTDLLALLGFEHSRCAFVNGGECYAKAAEESIDVAAFAKDLGPMWQMLSQSQQHLGKCGLGIDQPEGWRLFGGGAPGRSAPYYGGGDGHTAQKIEVMKQSEDQAFKFIFTWLVADRSKGWTIHYRPVHPPISDEIAAVFEFLHIQQFTSCPQFDFESCYWRFIPFNERGDDMSFNRPADRAHAWFDAHKDSFSLGVERLLAAEQKANSFGMRILPARAKPSMIASLIGSGKISPDQKEVTKVKAFEYDVALSFAGTERVFAEKLAQMTRDAGFNVFYDGFYPEQLWGKDLVEFFDSVYRKKSRYCVMFISREYRDRMWTTHERRSALARALEEKGNEYLLPIEVEKVDIDGLRPTIGRISLAEHNVGQISQMLIAKLKARP